MAFCTIPCLSCKIINEICVEPDFPFLQNLQASPIRPIKVTICTARLAYRLLFFLVKNCIVQTGLSIVISCVTVTFNSYVISAKLDCNRAKAS